MSQHLSHKLSIVQGTLIVLGTSIGGGMLGLPIMTSESGFFPSSCMLLLSWFFMTITGLILAELSCQKKKNANLLSIYSTAFPRIGAFLATAVYFLLFYSLMVAYLLALGRMFFDYKVLSFFGVESLNMYIALIGLLGAIFLMEKSSSWFSKLNGLLVVIMGISYVIFSSMSFEIIDPIRLSYCNWSKTFIALPLIFTSFGFQGTIPSLASLMEYDRRALFSAIFFGSFLTLLIYLMWQAIIIGSIPLEGYMGLLFSKEQGLDAIAPLVFHLPSTISVLLVFFGKMFAISAIATSLLGVSLGMRDFLRDLFQSYTDMNKNHLVMRFGFSCAVFLPSLLFSALYPNGFLTALSVAGGIGCAFLLGIMPIVTGYFTQSQLDIYEKKWINSIVSCLFHPSILILSFLFFAAEIIGESFSFSFFWK